MVLRRAYFVFLILLSFFSFSGITHAADTIWVEDAIPAGATTGGNETWSWLSSNPVPYSGSLAHQSANKKGLHQHLFQNVPVAGRLSVSTGDSLYAYVYLDPASPPSEIMLQWHDGTWEHRAYWGANLILKGTDGTNSRRYMGALPAAGQWVRLVVPASQVGLEGKTLRGMSYLLYNGRATWDQAGKASPAVNTPPTVSLTNPANGSSFSAPASFTIDASASDSDGSISKVEFYNGATLLNTDTTAPYSYAWSSVAAGSYSLTAKAYDNSGASTTSSAVSVSVIAAVPSVTLSANPGSITSGGSSTLTWSSTNATSCTASGAWSGSKVTSGNQSTGVLTATSTYTLTCSGAGGSASQSATVTVTPVGGVSSLSGTVDSSLIANLLQNSVYIYAGNVTPDDIGGSGAQPLLTAAVTQDNSACTWRYNVASLADGQYTLAFTNQAARDIATGNDAIIFSRVALVTVSGGVSSYNFTPLRLLQVGPGKPYANVLSVASAVQSGDVIEIDAGQYDDNIVVWRANDITLRGVGGRAHMRATKLIDYVSGNDEKNGKALWVTQGSNIKVENIEFSNAAVADKNGAGIRIEGAGLSVCNGYFHNNENGVLGGAGEMLIERSEFAYNGGCPAGFGCSHNVYISGGSKLVFRNNYSHHASIGHLLKTRAQENHILYNRLTSESGGTASYEVDVPDGGLTYLIGNLIHQSTQPDNSSLVSYAAESRSNPVQQLYAINNTLVNDYGSGTAFVITAGATAQLTNNLFVGAGAFVSGSATQTTNLTSSAPNFVNQAAYDYRLTASSPGINGGTEPGTTAGGFALAPVSQYLHPLSREERPLSGARDIGAYEYVSGGSSLPTVSLSANSASITSGGSSTLSWSSTNATSCTASGAWSGAKAVSGSETRSNLTTISVYTLSCSGAGGSASQSVTVSVIPLGGNPIDSLQAGYWYAAPKSNMSAVDPCPARDCAYSGSGGQATVMSAWSGGAYDTLRDRLMVWGGGHGDYGGNELYAFDIGTLSWSRLSEPSTLVESAVSHYPDGKPSARHTYNALQYAASADRLVSMSASATFGGNPGFANAVDAFNLGTSSWEKKATAPVGGANVLTAYDSTTGHIWFIGSGYSPSYEEATALREYDPLTDTWTKRDSGNSDLDYTYSSAAFDSKRHLFVVIGDGHLSAWDVSNPARVTRTNPATAGMPSEVLNSQAPGIDYDPVSDRFVVWNGGATVYTLDPATWSWSTLAPAAGNTVVPSAAEIRGTYGRFRYIPSKNAFVVVNRTTESVYFYKLSTGGGSTPAPTVTLSADPVSVSSGGSSTLIWSSSNASSCTASGAWSGTRATAGAEGTSALSVNSTYTLTCSGSGGSASQSVTVTVTTGTPAPTVTLSANPTTVASGGSSTLSWSSSNASTCTASGAWSGAKSTSGSESTGALTVASTYTLSCTGTGGSASQSVTVGVSVPPPLGLVANVNIASTSSAAQSNVPVTFGHAFKAGDVPAGTSLTAQLTNGAVVQVQTDHKATHADGSLRHGVLTLSLPTLAANATQQVQLSTTIPAAGTSVQLSDLLATSFDTIATLQVGATAYTASARTLLQTTPPQTWLSGPLVSEWIVGGTVKDSAGNPHPHLAVYFHVRAYAGLNRVRVDTVIENNWTLVTSPQDFTYDFTLTVGGLVAYSKPGLVHYHHARWHRVAWWGDAAQANTLHDHLYLQDSKAVPKFATLTPTSTYLGGMISSIEPMTNGNLNAYMPMTGAQDGIGPLPRWTAAYLVSGDARAKASTLANGDAGGSYSVHYRDEATGYPVSIMQRPTLSLQNTTLPTVSSTAQPYTHDDAHQPSIAYVPYLLSGDYFYLEELQFWATWNLVWINESYREYEKGYTNGQTRAQAWTLRELGRAGYITPDAHPLKSYYNTVVENNLARADSLYANNPAATPLGIQKDYYDGYSNVAMWQHDFYSWTYGHLVELGFTNAVPMRNWTAKFPAGRMGIASNEYCYVYAAPYRLNVGPDNNATYPDFRTWYQAVWPTESQSACPALTANNMTGYANEPTGYPANMRPALAISVDAGAAGASDAWSRLLIGSQPDYNDNPQWAVAPR